MNVVYFHDRDSNKREIGRTDNEEEARKIIKNFLDERNYVSHYWRFWQKEDGIMTIDVGSHTEHFTIEMEESK